MPKAATSQDGPQAVPSYEYPAGTSVQGGYEWVYRSARVKDDDTTRNATHTLEVTDGQGGLPIEHQPKTMVIRLAGITHQHTKFTLSFKRPVGQEGPYTACMPTLTPYSGPGQPHTQAQ